jgi:prolyl-tRNA editing enzyme YbaK/EbsC (Cys-tRNA(Pro) deacylase)
VLVAGPARISWRALRAYLGRSRLTTAREAEVQEVTGYPVGAVSPFGLPKPLRTLVDEGVTTQNGEISIGAGVRHATVILTAADLLRALGDVEIGQFTETD